MKIEIELEELEQLRNKSKDQETKINNLNQQLKVLDAQELRKHSVDVAEKMFEAVITEAFKNLGFTNPSFGAMGIDFRNLEHYHGEDWMHDKRLQVTIGATISKDFKRAFLNMGINT